MTDMEKRTNKARRYSRACARRRQLKRSLIITGAVILLVGAALALWINLLGVSIA